MLSTTYTFLQILDTNHTPAKVTVFVNEINKEGSNLSMKTKHSNNSWFLITVHSQNIHVAARIAIAVLGLPFCSLLWCLALLRNNDRWVTNLK